MLASTATTKLSTSLNPTKLTQQSKLLKTKNDQVLCFTQKTSPFFVNSVSGLKLGQPTKTKPKFNVFASSAAGAALTGDQSPNRKKKLGVVVKPMVKLRLVLKFIWMKNAIGIALDQVIPSHGTIPLSGYYFWPKEDAWDQLKLLLEGKPWISYKQMCILLNQATEVINLWQETNHAL